MKEERVRSQHRLQTEFRKLPALDALLQAPAIQLLDAEYGRANVTDALRALLDEQRTAIARGAHAPDEELWPQLVQERLEQMARPSLLPVINATGVIVHTNLGRAPLSAAAREAVQATSLAYSNLEYRLENGQRGSRHDHARERLCQLTGAEDALVVNNNAGAVYLTLAGLCQGYEVVVSRGQLVEIGGGFRIPDVLRQSGATLVEVGTTNRTHPRDYADAIHEQTAALMRIHSSNFSKIGFVTEPSLEEMANIAHSSSARGDEPALLIDDLGSGTLLDTAEFGLAPEPMIQSSLAAGADIVTFSGDKLLGGPQAGLILGRASLIERLRRHPMARALRVDKMTLAALDATLRIYQQGRALEQIPVWQMISATKGEMEVRADRWKSALTNTSGIANSLVSVVEGESAVGGGSLPGETLPSRLLAIESANVNELSAKLRNCATPIVGRIQHDQLLLDPRTVLPEQDDVLIQAVGRALSQLAGIE